MEYKVIVDYSCFSVPARVRPKQGNTSNISRKLYFVISKMHIFQHFSIFFKLLSNPSKSIEIVENCTSEVGKHINNGDISYPQMLFLQSSLKSNQSNFQLHWSKRKVVSSIQTKNPVLDLLTIERCFLNEKTF